MVDFTSKLRTNYCPTEQEIPLLTNLLSEPCVRLSHIDAKIAQLQAAIDVLLQERAEIASFVAEHQALLSPVRRLPRDILEAIFLTCLPTNRNAAMVANEAPLLLTRICSAWRSVALSSPRLWARFHVQVPFRTQSDVDRESAQAIFQWRLTTTKLWLERAHSVPLTISLYCDTNFDLMDRKLPESWPEYPFLATLLNVASRWEDITLNLPEKMFDAPAFMALKPPTFLNSAALPSPHGYTTQTIRGRWRPLLSSKLRHCVHWSALTELSISNPSWQHEFTLETLLMFAIPACPALVSLAISIYEYGDAKPPPEQPLEAPHLQSLTLYIHNTPSSPLRCLRYLSLPRLRDLRVLSAQQLSVGRKLDALDIERFFATSSNLKSICFDADCLRKKLLSVLIRALPPSVRRFGVHQNVIFEREDLFPDGELESEGNGEEIQQPSDESTDDDNSSQMGSGSSDADEDDVQEEDYRVLCQSLDDDNLALLSKTIPDLVELVIVNVQTITDAAILDFLLAGKQTLKKVLLKVRRMPSSPTVDILGHPAIRSAVESSQIDLSLNYPPPSQHDARPTERVLQVWEGGFFAEE
ncbi:F-box domain-containing protein [Mycena kentingensis (nom. inval.)]|nr:F-box domain-containing protein [Mycena kentingensis (nom. inval.)]